MPDIHPWARYVRLCLCVIALACACIAGYRVWHVEVERRAVKSDLKELSHVTYGLFNVDEWVTMVTRIIERKVDQLQVTDENRPELRAQLVELMSALIDEVERSMDRANQKAGFKGDLRKAAFGLLVPLDAIKADVPNYADRLLDELNKPGSRDRIRDLLRNEFCKMTATTASLADYRFRDRLMAREGIADLNVLRSTLYGRSVALTRTSRTMVWVLLASVTVLIILSAFAGAGRGAELYLLLAAAGLLLFLGVLLPMIDIEASIGCFSLQLIGEEICFQDQVLYFQSKSILEVVWLMLRDRDPGLMVIGLLVLLFSVLLPVAKLAATLRVLVTGRAPTTALGGFLVYRSGKWSMADVLVVAMFMTYLGFNGVVNGQLAQLQMQDPRTELLTTNGSALQAGFYIFLMYCIMGLVVSTLVQRKLGKEMAPAS